MHWSQLLLGPASDNGPRAPAKGPSYWAGWRSKWQDVSRLLACLTLAPAVANALYRPLLIILKDASKLPLQLKLHCTDSFYFTQNNSVTYSYTDQFEILLSAINVTCYQIRPTQTNKQKY